MAAATAGLKADITDVSRSPGVIGKAGGFLQPNARAGVFSPSVRADFPSVARETYLNSGAMHPVGTFTADAMKSLIDYRAFGPGEGRADFGAAKQDELKKKFGALINASASEIAFTANTTDGENIVVMGLDLA